MNPITFAAVAFVLWALGSLLTASTHDESGAHTLGVALRLISGMVGAVVVLQVFVAGLMLVGLAIVG